MTGFLLGCQGYATGLPGAPVGEFLESYDVEAHGGRGSVSWTADPARALRFVSSAAALDCWKQQSGVAPLRADGQPNRPLVAFTVGVRPAGGSA
ncbi:MAG: hypothetical protein L0H93_07850 [Nocardioides sp.]|nr:hypothetical protein [Nocardioides sp.]